MSPNELQTIVNRIADNAGMVHGTFAADWGAGESLWLGVVDNRDRGNAASRLEWIRNALRSCRIRTRAIMFNGVLVGLRVYAG